MLKIPDSMYSKGPKNNPSPGKSSDTSGKFAYGDSEIRMLSGEPQPIKIGDVRISHMGKKYAPEK